VTAVFDDDKHHEQAMGVAEECCVFYTQECSLEIEDSRLFHLHNKEQKDQ
jgi:hypothetical protein